MEKRSHPNEEMSEKVNAWIKAYQLNKDEEALNQLILHYKGLIEIIARK